MSGSAGSQSLVGTPFSKPALSPSGSSSSLEVALQRNNAFTKYLGGKFLTWYSVSVILSSLALLGLSIYLIFLYRISLDDRLGDYLVTSSIQIHQDAISSFLGSSLTAMEALNDGSKVSTALLIQPAITSLTVVADLISGAYFVYTNSSGSVVTTSNAADCVNSVSYSCDSTYSLVSGADWVQQLVRSSSKYIFMGPFASATGKTTTNSIDLLWAFEGSMNKMTLNLSYLSFANDGFLDNSGGTQRVWLVNNSSMEILQAYGVSLSEYVEINSKGGGVSVTNLMELAPSLPDGSWITALDNSFSSNLTQNELFKGLPNRVSALIAPVPDTSFTLLVGSTSVEFSDSRVYLFLIVLIVVSALPLICTGLATLGYLLRLIAVKRRKEKRQRELEDAQKALSAIRESKLKSFAAVSTMAALANNKLT